VVDSNSLIIQQSTVLSSLRLSPFATVDAVMQRFAEEAVGRWR
jgi:hypothetical protein